MSYQNFGDGNSQPQQGAEEQGGFGAAQQMGQQMDPNQQQNQFAGGAQQAGGPGAPGAPGSQSGDQKTTLWYESLT